MLSAGSSSTAGEIIPRILMSLLDIVISRAFIPPCIRGLTSRKARGLPLSDQSSAHADRNPRRTFSDFDSCKWRADTNSLLLDRGYAGKTGTCVVHVRERRYVCCAQQVQARTALVRCQRAARRESFCNNSRSVRRPEVPAMRSRISDFRRRNSVACFML